MKTVSRRLPRITWLRVLTVLCSGAAVALVVHFVGSHDWVYGLSGGVVVALGSFWGTRWRSQDHQRNQVQSEDKSGKNSSVD